MQFRKMAAVAGSALMAGMTLAGAAIAATNVGNIASLATPSDSVANFPIFVIGKTAASADVAGAIDIAVRMAAESKTTTSVTTTSTSASVTGVDRDGIATGTTAAAGTALSTAISGGSAFPNSAVILTTHFSGLKDSTISWKSADYDYKEQVDVSAVRMSHDLATDKVNGSEKMVIGTSGDIKYQYVFDKTINISAATTAGTTGTIASPEYTNPIKIKLLGKDFTIVGIGTSSVKMLSGTVGTAKKQGTAVTGIASGDYTIYVTGAVNNDWASFEIKDKTGNVVDTLSGITEGNSKDSSATGLTVKVTDSRVSGTDPATQVVEADIVVGKTGYIEKEYDGTADVDSTGTSNEAFDTANPRWGIQYTATGLTEAGNQQIPAGAKIEVVYKPTEKQYLKPGEKVVLPNNYGELGFTGWNTDIFAKISIEPSGQVSAYNYTDKALVGSSFYGLKFSSDKSGVFKAEGNFYTTAYLLFNGTYGAGTHNISAPVAVGYKDETSGKILVNNSFRLGTTAEYYQGVSYGWAKLNATIGSAGQPLQNFTYNYTLNYGEQDFILNVLVGNNTVQNVTVGTATTGGSAAATLSFSFQNRTAWTGGGNDLSAELFRLGPTASSAEATDINVTTGGTIGAAGAKTQDEIVDDSGVILLTPNTYTASDKVVFKVPSKTLGVKAYFGLTGAAATTGGTSTSSTVIPVTTDVVKLDTEVVSADGLSVLDTYKTQNLIVVGGPAVNQIAAQLLSVSFPSYGAASGIAQNTAVVKVLQDKYATGKVAVLVAGYEAANTDAAALAIQSGKLAGNNATSVVLTGTDVNSLVIS
ncbi:MAG: hypothetical protein WA139_02735 [Candidatus Aenigmatarchaeota archaeon]